MGHLYEQLQDTRREDEDHPSNFEGLDLMLQEKLVETLLEENSIDPKDIKATNIFIANNWISNGHSEEYRQFVESEDGRTVLEEYGRADDDGRKRIAKKILNRFRTLH